MSEFDPDWTVKPGETLREWIEENGLTVRSTATACAHMDPAVVQGIIDGRRKITRVYAAKLQHGTGIPARLWLNLERAYRADLAAGKIDA
jgi:HTH-type transcriptional regulator/antitoxin HigA